MLRTVSPILALSLVGAVVAIELRDIGKSMFREPPRGLVEASLIPPLQRPKPRPMALGIVAVPDRLMENPRPLTEWAETVDLDLRHSLRF